MGEGRRLPHGSCVHHTQGHAHGVWTERSQDRAVAVAVYGRGQNSPAPQPPRGHIHEEMKPSSRGIEIKNRGKRAFMINDGTVFLNEWMEIILYWSRSYLIILLVSLLDI